MRNMYHNRKKNIAIVLFGIILFAGALGLMRAQAPIIGDVLWMKAMLTHHSIAILTSKRADIQDHKVKKLAEDIIKAQEREIAEMKAMIKRLENNE